MSQQQQQQQMQQMSGMAGGPVGGGGGPQQQPQMMNAGTPSSGDGNAISAIKRLNTAIYDHLLRQGMYDVARAFLHTKVEMELDNKKSPSQRGQANGVGDDGMDVDSAYKDRPDDLPAPAALGEGPFLQDWWCQFWEIYWGYRGRGKEQTQNFIGHQRQLQKARNNMMATGGMDAASMQRMQLNGNMMMQGGMNAMGMQADLKRTAMQNRSNTNMTPQQLQHMQNQMKMAGSNQMERSGSQMDMNGPRSNSPASGDQPSPKRQRTDANGNMTINRPGPPGSNNVGFPSSTPQPSTPNANMPTPDPNSYAHVHGLLKARGIDPNDVSQDRIFQVALQPADHRVKSVDAYSASIQQTMKSSLNKMSQQGVPPNMAGSPMNPGMDPNNNEFFQAANGRGPGSMPPNMMPGGPNAAAVAGQNANGSGNHALQDYQMQLMLLEQQNKKRLLMARQEQDSMANPGMPGGGGQFPGGMSPGSQARGGDPSPNAGDVRHGTPKMSKGMSPNSGDMAGRGSPQPGMMPGMGNDQMRHMMAPNGQMMRPPSSHPMGPQGQPLGPDQMAMLQNPTGRTMMPTGQQFNPNMMPGQPGGPPGPNMTPRSQTMGPPPAPQSGTQPSSPAQPPAPPTPSQGNKAKPGNKKGDAGKKGNAKKGGQTGVTPASEPSEQPPTPTPATPATPHNPNNAFAHNHNKNLQNGNQVGQQNPPPMPPQQQMPQDLNNPSFGHLGATGGPGGGPDDFGVGLNIGDFSNLEGTDVLDTFDFDTFLNNDGDVGGFGGVGFADLAFGDGGGLEAGGGGLGLGDLGGN
ncbi:hypothetical protein LTR86_007144 [Recurvomyces mirabilis]|nr:hypothetical protein LTR86_007144 [Recurvomyces mirabilis]